MYQVFLHIINVVSEKNLVSDRCCYTSFLLELHLCFGPGPIKLEQSSVLPHYKTNLSVFKLYIYFQNIKTDFFKTLAIKI